MSLRPFESSSAAPLGGAKPDAHISVVVPVLNALRYLPRTIASVLNAVANTKGVELIYVDNGSTDGSYEYLKSISTSGIQVYRFERGTAAATRNFGVHKAHGDFLSFLDADCLIGKGYFGEALGVLRATGAAATGCEVELPSNPRWIEATWQGLHYIGRDREVHYLNSANFFISRKAFEHVGGFREDLPSGEDAEIGQQLTGAGYRIHESPTVSAIHLGNPKSVQEFYRRNVWHALGMFGTVSRRSIDKPTAMMGLHLLATIGGLLIIFSSHLSLPIRGLIAIALQFCVPAATVAYRANQTRRATRWASGIILYWLYYWARLNALVLVVAGQSKRLSRAILSGAVGESNGRRIT